MAERKSPPGQEDDRRVHKRPQKHRPAGQLCQVNLTFIARFWVRGCQSLIHHLSNRVIVIGDVTLKCEMLSICHTHPLETEEDFRHIEPWHSRVFSNSLLNHLTCLCVSLFISQHVRLPRPAYRRSSPLVSGGVPSSWRSACHSSPPGNLHRQLARKSAAGHVNADVLS